MEVVVDRVAAAVISRLVFATASMSVRIHFHDFHEYYIEAVPKI